MNKYINMNCLEIILGIIMERDEYLVHVNCSQFYCYSEYELSSNSSIM